MFAMELEGNRLPRPRKTLSDDQVREVETLAALLNQDQIADYLGICRNTFRAICTREPEVLARYKKGKAKAIAHVANGLLQKARAGDTTSSIFYLKTQAGWRETTHLEHRGPERGPIALAPARTRLAALIGAMHDRTRPDRTAVLPDDPSGSAP